MPKKDEPVDGRQNPSQFDLNKVKAFRGETGVKRQDKRRAAEVTSTPVTHQSGRGIKSVREKWRDISKVGVIRFCAAQGYDYDRTTAFIAKTFQTMTAAVFDKAWREGQNGQAPEIEDRETLSILRRECR